jgi:hypothetical protein
MTTPSEFSQRNEAADDSSSEEEEDEGQRQLWSKVESALDEYHLSPFAMVAAKKWVKLMADSELSANLPFFHGLFNMPPCIGLDVNIFCATEDNTHLDRVREWLLLKINARSRATPQSKWQMGCPEIVPRLRAIPFWDISEPGLAWVREIQANYDGALLPASPCRRSFLVLRAPHRTSSTGAMFLNRHKHASDRLRKPHVHRCICYKRMQMLQTHAYATNACI